MPTRKTVDPADAPAPRRSTRISAQGKPEDVEVKAPKNNARKRAAAGAAVAEPGVTNTNTESNKKARSDAKTAEMTGHSEEDSSGGGGVEGEPGEADAADAVELVPAVEMGDTLPSLILKNEKDEDVQVADIAAEKGVVLFLVPKADTPGCTNQACGFRDIYQEFTTLGYDVYCLSADTPSAQTKWQTKKELPYHLLSDRHRVLIGALGAGEGGKTKRSHFVFEKGGKLVDKKIPVKPNDSPKLALEFVKGQVSN